MNQIHIARHRVTEFVVAWAHSQETLEAALTACRLKAEAFEFEVLTGQIADDFVRARRKA